MEKILDQDLQDYRFLSNLRLLEQNSYPTDLYLLNLENGQKRRLTGLGDASSFAPLGGKQRDLPRRSGGSGQKEDCPRRAADRLL